MVIRLALPPVHGKSAVRERFSLLYQLESIKELLSGPAEDPLCGWLCHAQVPVPLPESKMSSRADR